jgi:hypothetical protein
LSGWSVEELCDEKDKDRHAEAVFAELARRGIFTASELELIREGGIPSGIPSGTRETVLLCSWGLPRGIEVWDGVPWLVYYQPSNTRSFVRCRDEERRKLLVRIDTSLVAEILRDCGDGPRPLYRPARPAHDVPSGADTFSGRDITGSVSEPDSFRSIFD